MKIDDAAAHVYVYDCLYQLTNVDYNDGNSTGYSYDSLGNRTDVNDGSSTSYLRNRLNQYYSVDGNDYIYDENGNLTNINDGEYEYVYDCENQLIEAKKNSQTVATYGYDFEGRRVSKTVGQTTTKYCYDGEQVIAEYNGSSLLRKFIYGPGIDEPICMIAVAGQGETVYYYHFDGLGSVAALSNNSGDIVERYSYDVFGEPNRESSLNNPYLFTGRRYDIETGLYYYRARYYKPEIGRFLQTDPIHYEDGINMYVYAQNNPVMNIDPLGLDAASGWNPPAPPGYYDKMCCKKYGKRNYEILGKTRKKCRSDILGDKLGGTDLDYGITIGGGILCFVPGCQSIGIGMVGGPMAQWLAADAWCNYRKCLDWGKEDICGECK